MSNNNKNSASPVQGAASAIPAHRLAWPVQSNDAVRKFAIRMAGLDPHPEVSATELVKSIRKEAEEALRTPDAASPTDADRLQALRDESDRRHIEAQGTLRAAASSASGAKGAADPSALLTEDHRERIIGAVLGAFPSTVTSAPTARRMMAQLVWNTEQACIAALAERAQAAQPSGAVPEAFEAAAKALTERAAGHFRNKDDELQDECLQCAAMIRDMKPAATPAPEQEAAQEMICKRCGVDRLKTYCPKEVCEFVGDALAAPVAQEAEQPQGDVMRPFGAPAGQHDAAVELLAQFVKFHDEPASVTLETIIDKKAFAAAIADVDRCEAALIARAKEIISQHNSGAANTNKGGE